ncbi:MAG: DUF7674 family protein [bacterium]
MDYNNLSNCLLIEIPEIKEMYEEELKLWDEYPGNHNIFGDVVNPYLIDLLNENNDKKLLKRIFSFLEKMANSKDVKVQEVLTVTVLERLGDDKKILSKSYEYMEKETKQFSVEVEKWLKRN